MRARRLLIVALAGIALTLGSALAYREISTPRRTTPVYDPPVLAGQQVWGYCAGGVFARKGDQLVVTSSGHCAAEGTVAYEADGVTVRGVFSAPLVDPTCPYPDHTCAASDMNYLVVDPARIPWGSLNVIDMGAGGYRVLDPGTRALSCAEIAVDAPVEIDGNNVYRQGRVIEKGENLKDPAQDGTYFPCMIAADIEVGPGDSGGIVLVDGIPAGVTSRSFGGLLGFTPLAEGLEALGLQLCTTPDCDLERP